MDLLNLLPDGHGMSKKDEEIFMILLGLVIFTSIGGPRKEGPAWRKSLPPASEKLAGPWRGKGSFGKGFGPQTRRR